MDLLFGLGGLKEREIGNMFDIDYSTVSVIRKRLRHKIQKDNDLKRLISRIEKKPVKQKELTILLCKTSFSKDRKSNGLVFLFCFLFLILLTTTTQAVAQDILWTTKASMHIPRTDFGVAVVNNKIYAIRGYTGSTVSLVEKYDLFSNTWTRKADMPTPRRMLVVAEVNDKVYAIGGASFVNSGYNHVTYSFATEEYNPLTDSWTINPDIPMI